MSRIVSRTTWAQRATLYSWSVWLTPAFLLHSAGEAVLNSSLLHPPDLVRLTTPTPRPRSFFVITIGYTYGWIGLITAHVGTWCGHGLGFFTSRYCVKKSVTAKVETLPPQWKEWVELVQGGVAQSSGGVVFAVLVRWGSPLPFGMCNTFDAALTQMSYLRSLAGSVIASQKDITLMVYIGTLVRQMDNAEEVGSGDEESKRREANVRIGLFVGQIAMIIGLLLLVSWWSKRTLKARMVERRAMEVTSDIPSAYSYLYLYPTHLQTHPHLRAAHTPSPCRPVSAPSDHIPT